MWLVCKTRAKIILSDPETSLTTPRLLPLRRLRRSNGNHQSPQSSGSSRKIMKRLGRSGRSYGNQALWKSPPSFNSQECEGMRSRVLTFEASGIDHVGLIQICFSAEATVSHVCQKKSLPVSVVSRTNSALTSSNSRIKPKTCRLCAPNLVKKSQLWYILERRESSTSPSAEVKIWHAESWNLKILKC